MLDVKNVKNPEKNLRLPNFRLLRKFVLVDILDSY